MIYLSEAVFAVITVLTAYLHSRLIKDQKVIDHTLWFVIMAVILVVNVIIIQRPLGEWWKAFTFMLACSILRMVIFDLFLNLFRGEPLFYQSQTTTSKEDQAENKLFNTGIWRRLFGDRTYPLYIVLVIIFITLQFFLHDEQGRSLF